MNQNKQETPEIKNDKQIIKNDLSDIETMLSEYKEKAQVESEPSENIEPKKRGRKRKVVEQEQEQQQINAGNVISGALVLMLIDLLIPKLLTLANNKFNKKKKIKSKQLQLTTEQRTSLEPIADLAMKQIMLQGNPLTVLTLSLIGIYGLNFLMLQNE